MNLQNIFNELENVDPEIYGRLDTRRQAMQQFSKIGGRIALAAVPFALGSMLSKAYGQPTSSVTIDVLTYALKLEYLEAAFYTAGVAKSGLIASGDVAAITTIRDHENAHVAFLKSTLTTLGATIPAVPTFDFTAGGTFSDVMTNYATFLAVAQTFEDTGVRAYKGRAAEIVKGGAYLTAALNIHSVEARHASHIRTIRRKATGDATIKSWITNAVPTVAGVAASYAGEDNVTQAGFTITNINGTSISAANASEAFDEPLTAAAVLAIVKPFGVV